MTAETEAAAIEDSISEETYDRLRTAEFAAGGETGTGQPGRSPNPSAGWRIS